MGDGNVVKVADSAKELTVKDDEGLPHHEVAPGAELTPKGGEEYTSP